MTIGNYYRQLIASLEVEFSPEESRFMAFSLLEHFLELPKAAILLHSEAEIAESAIGKLTADLDELLQHRPLQYVLGKAWFHTLELKVDETVLIPRPETEEMVQMIISEIKSSPTNKAVTRILDMGTGSGCIAIALKKAFPESEVFAVDVSERALHTAANNALLNGTRVNFMHFDILEKTMYKMLPQVDYLISNPPYVTQKDKVRMQRNVLEYEPHSALFVPEQDPLIFYRALSEIALTVLPDDGHLWLEINEEYGREVKALFENLHYSHTEIMKDFKGVDRFVRAIKR